MTCSRMIFGAMSHQAMQELEKLQHVAHELGQTFEERGHRVDQAMEADTSFGSPTSRSALARDLARDTVSQAASGVGLDYRPVNGSGRELRSFVDGTDRRYRLLRANPRADGTYSICANASSTVAVEEPTLIPTERWVFAYTLSSDMLIESAFIARVLGVEGTMPGRLVLGGVTELLSRPVDPLGGFTGTDEELEGFGSDEDEDFGSDSSS